MSLENQNNQEPNIPPKKEEKRSKPVVVYIMILFIAAFLLMALSFLMHQRSNTEALGKLQNSVTAMQEVQANQEKIIALQEQLAAAEDALDAQEKSNEEALAALEQQHAKEMEAAQLEKEALLSLYTLQQQYLTLNFAVCQETIEQFEAAGYIHHLPESAGEGLSTPTDRYYQLKDAVSARLAK